MSELYAAMLMVGVTLALGSVVVAAAASQFGLANDAASVGSSLNQRSAGTQLSLVYSAVPPSGSCPEYQGNPEGTVLGLGVYDYGTEGFTPAGFMVNSTLYAGGYAEVLPGSLGAYSISLGVCAHQAGQTVLAYDAYGDVVQFGT